MNHRIYKPASTSIAIPDELNGVPEKTDIISLKLEDEEDRKNISRNSQANRHVVKMLVAVVVAFFICWAPFHAQRLLAIYGEHTSLSITTFEVLTYISGVLYYLSTTVNPLLYHIMSHKYKAAFKATYKHFCGSSRSHHDHKRRCHNHTSPNALAEANSQTNTSPWRQRWQVCTTLDGHWLFPIGERSVRNGTTNGMLPETLSKL
ncbi:unnamed protein product [Acanthoscelides obtectus]|uniref:G-protein coupled receptors family 1 profile domain-containing protein n=1 Tax=Acanthoscelides obtectus TaxID=200917 RepID=A0A9P0LRA4_ACAOB|nr:unnamed protein product [Acanthoscelides obtectus]CAK1665547.1 Pyrokinin-1 receptor [Acanthoscelides obtectus]